MSDIYFIADLHLGHDSVLKWRPRPDGEPFSCTEEHDNFLVDNWNRVVGKRDVVWVLGDVAFNQRGLESLSRLRGIKHLVMGNHDRYLRNFHVNFFSRVGGCYSFKRDYLLTHIPAHPMSVRPRFHFNIHGHTHDRHDCGEEYFNVCVEKVDFKPHPWDEIKAILDYRTENFNANV